MDAYLLVGRKGIVLAETTHFLRKGKYHCTADLLFDWLGFGQTSKSVYSFNSTKQLNPYEVSECSLVLATILLHVDFVYFFACSCLALLTAFVQ